MITTTTTIYYLCRSEDVNAGLFGTADECAYWYLSYGGAECRIYPHTATHGGRKGKPNAEDAQVEDGKAMLWHVALKSPDTYLFRELTFTVVGKDKKDAYNALRQYIIDNKLLGSADNDDDFYMCRAEQALPSLIRKGEMRELYDFAGQPAAADDEEVTKWFCNAEHSKDALMQMVDILTRRRRMPLGALHAEQIKSQISDSAASPTMPVQSKTASTPSIVFQ